MMILSQCKSFATSVCGCPAPTFVLRICHLENSICAFYVVGMTADRQPCTGKLTRLIPSKPMCPSAVMSCWNVLERLNWTVTVCEHSLCKYMGKLINASSHVLIFFNVGGESLHLAQLLELWKEKNAGHCSRLILVLDTENSLPWVKEVRRVEGTYVAAQAAELSNTGVDPEARDVSFLGDFTSEWVEFNCNPGSDTQWLEKGRSVAAVYSVSKRWSDYTLHLPTGSDVAKHWKTHFPKATYPLVHLSNWCCGLNVFWLCGVCLRCFRRCKLAWFPPAVLDTGLGIKLVHS